MHTEKQGKCLFCNASFSTKSHLKTHEDSIHKRIKFDCQECGKQFKQKGALTKHINTIHNMCSSRASERDKRLNQSSPSAWNLAETTLSF